MREVREAELTIAAERTWNLATPPLRHSSFTFIGQFKRKPLENCGKAVKNESKTISSGNGTARNTVRSLSYLLRVKSKINRYI